MATTSKKAIDETETTQYFQLAKMYEEKYGKNCVLLYQMGSFFEIYGYSSELIEIGKTDLEENSEIEQKPENQDFYDFDENNDEYQRVPETLLGSCIKELNQFLQLKIATTNKKYWQIKEKSYYPVFMSGFRDYSLDNYLQQITSNNFTAIVYVQKKLNEEEKKEKKCKNDYKRELFGIYTCGTYLQNDDTNELMPNEYEGTTKNISNNILVIWIETIKPFNMNIPKNECKENLIMGIAIYNLFDGTFNILEIQTPKYMFISTFDELQRIFSIYLPSETIIISSLTDDEINKIIDFASIQSMRILKHFISNGNIEKNESKNESKKIFQNCAKQQYLEYIVNKLFGTNHYQHNLEFVEYQYGTQAFAYLVHYLQEHNPNFTKNIRTPIFHSFQENIKLANYTLKQLNILPSTNNDIAKIYKTEKHNLNSLCSLLNKCITPMGKRIFYSQIVNPTKNITWIENEYYKINLLLQSKTENIIEKIRTYFQKIDLDKIIRQFIIYEKITPNKIYHLYSNAKQMINLYYYLQQNEPELLVLIEKEIKCLNFEEKMNEFIEFLNGEFIIKICKSECFFGNFTNNILHPEKYENVKKYENKIINCELSISNFQLELNNYFEQNISQISTSTKLTKSKKSKKTTNEELQQTNEVIKKCETDNRGITLQITESKTKHLKMLFAKYSKTFNLTIYDDNYEPKNVEIHSKDIIFQKYTKANNIIKHQYLQQLIDDMNTMKKILDTKIANEYIKIMDQMKNYGVHLNTLSSFISAMDCTTNKALCSKKYNYTKPIIDNSAFENNESYLIAKELRHPLVEQINCNEIYVPNDVELKDEKQMIIFGTNSAGKSSLVKSIGIAIIMAQSGMFVSATEFKYSPYHSIFSRIETKDNIYKGLSSFALEMCEFQTIIKYANKNSLVIGDELCSGTETQSALSIFVSGLEYLSSVNSTYLFASHFHEIVHWDEISNLKEKGLQICHIAMYYNAEKDKMVYSRKLQKGSGETTYGLEYCKSIKMPNDFLERSYNLRTKYFSENRGFLSLDKTKYNAKKLKEVICEICGVGNGDDVHHLNEQKNANKNGFIGTFHKNHPANLITICKKCHALEHSNNITTL